MIKRFILIIFHLLLVVSVFGQTDVQKLTHPAGDFVSVNGKKIWYESEGTGEPLLLITGGPDFLMPISIRFSPHSPHQIALFISTLLEQENPSELNQQKNTH
jgi:hypothetical protein